MAGPANAQSATLGRFLDAWKSWSAQGQLDCFTDDVTQRTMPLSLGIPAKSRKEIEVILPTLAEVVNNYELTVQHVVHDTERGKASIFATSSGDTAFGDWRQEYAVFLNFNETGEKICQIDEMMDSIFLMEFAPSFKQYLADPRGQDCQP